MVETQESQVSSLLSDFNTRLRDIEEKNRILHERTMLLSQNFVLIKDSADDEIRSLKQLTGELQRDVEKIKEKVGDLVSETDKFVRKGEIVIIERMLRDFQPLKFVRVEDVESVVARALAKQKNIKSVPDNE